MSHFLGIKKLQQAIWCEIFVVREGYIPYLRTWSRKSPRSSVKQHQGEGEVHSDVQRLVPGTSSGKHSELPEVANSTTEDKPLKHEVVGRQKELARKRNQVATTRVQENN